MLNSNLNIPPTMQVTDVTDDKNPEEIKDFSNELFTVLFRVTSNYKEVLEDSKIL